ncbi:MAG: AlwI family type II restriction endonuclease [Candidatus Gracilibacteria bacterium]|jgi:hypothetical protein|nr:AlwI family type II restriction endonuclease [Candidatus Gracilibacteria bacterium]
MKKPWSITTTLRNPERLREFLLVLREIEGVEWNLENQKKYQILLIQNRVYGYGSAQFYGGLSRKQVELIDDASKPISYEEAEEIFNAKGYEDPAMRGRQSINPLKKLGLVAIKDGKVFITSLGELLTKEDFDFGEMFFRSFLKWQIPNLDNRDYSDNGDYDIKPFIGILHLINAVNQKEIDRGEKAKGISKKEFSVFAPTLVHFQDVDRYADKIIELRDQINGKKKQEQKTIFDNFKKRFASEFLDTNEPKEISKLLSNLKDYGDNAIRYFRMTRYLYIRGGGFYVDLEPRRSVEIENLLASDNAKAIVFDSKEDYLEYISDITEPKLPWETKEKYIQIIEKLLEEITHYEKVLGIPAMEISEYQSFSDEELKNYISVLRIKRRDLQDKENHDKSQALDKVEEYINDLENIFDKEDRPILLEKLASLGLNALNDALKIKPNYPVGDDNEPTFTAPAGVPDIECYYEKFNAICEVTMLTGRDQWYNEGQPVMRHLRDFENSNNEKDSYCLFIAPRLHRDTVNTFWTSIKYEYEGKPQKIVPLSIQNFVKILKVLVQLKQNGQFLNHSELFRLYDEILSASRNHSAPDGWIQNIPEVINSWQVTLNA